MSAPDVVLLEPTSLLVQQSSGLRPNARASRRELTAEELSAANIYGGYAHLLVRTAAVRAEGFEEAERPVVGTPEAVVAIAQHIAFDERPRFIVLMVDGRNQLLAAYESAGGFHGEADMRDLLRAPLLVSANAVIYCHNHPEASSAPNSDDVALTAVLKHSLHLLGATLLDHVILSLTTAGKLHWASMMQYGLMR